MVRLNALLAAVAALAVAGLMVAAAAANRAHLGGHQHPAASIRPPAVATPPARVAAHPVHAARRADRRRHHHGGHAVLHEVLSIQSGRQVELHSSPDGQVVGRLGDRTDFGSQTTLAVVAHRSGWLGVTTTSLPNGTVGWIRPHSGDVSRGAVDVELDVSLSRRSIALRAGNKTLRTISVAIGRPGSETPTGRFAVTDKIAGTSFGPYYGCCILALSGHQPHTPPGWRGGDRLAIHGTDAPGTIGTPASAGCLRGADADLRVLMQRVPLGTPVVIRD